MFRTACVRQFKYLVYFVMYTYVKLIKSRLTQQSEFFVYNFKERCVCACILMLHLFLRDNHRQHKINAQYRDAVPYFSIALYTFFFCNLMTNIENR